MADAGSGGPIGPITGTPPAKRIQPSTQRRRRRERRPEPDEGDEQQRGGAGKGNSTGKGRFIDVRC